MILLAAPAAAQLRTGNIYFRAHDREERPLPGVYVYLRTPRDELLLRITDERGEARFLDLLPDRGYTIRAQGDDIRPIDYLAITVHAGRNTQVSMELLPGVVENLRIFSFAEPTLDRRDVAAGTTFFDERIEQRPGTFDLGALAASTPEVLVDRTGAALFYEGIEIPAGAAVDLLSVAEVHVRTGGSHPVLATAGATVDLITKRGRNTWAGAVRYRDLDEVIDRGIEGGGALKKDQLWIWGSYAKPVVRRHDLETTALALDGNLTFSDSFKAFIWNGDGTEAWKIEDTYTFVNGSYATGFYGRVEGQDQIRAEGATVFEAGTVQHDVRYGAAFRSGSRMDDRSLYAQDVLPFGPLTASVGLRWDRQDRASTVVPRLGLTWALGQDDLTLLSAGYSVFAGRPGQARTREAILGIQHQLEDPEHHPAVGLHLLSRQNRGLPEPEGDLLGARLSVDGPRASPWLVRGFFFLEERGRWAYGLDASHPLASALDWGLYAAASLVGREDDPEQPLLDLGLQARYLPLSAGANLGLEVLDALDRGAERRAYGFSVTLSYR
ncbi:MAG TPA: TonB-dependent receptor [Thermoanaerobaculia bacterium]|jgi:hypothetical protein|nr:TonB-dependent receptor [Thermoanaerobaculia bacterium]